MKQIKQLKVCLNFDGTPIRVGELVTDDESIYFKYASDFIASGIEISPVKMALSTEILSSDTAVFDGLFGVFNDALPDGWGRLLLDRTLIAKGILPQDISVLDRLACVGETGMGALTFSPEIELEDVNKKEVILDVIAKEMKHILEGTASSILDELYYLGGSSGGARPKVLVGYNPNTNDLIYGENNLTTGYQHWIIKFPSSSDLMDIANIEYAYYLMALDAGIEMTDSKLFTTASGKAYFGTKRFDRVNNQRLHMHSASGLLHDNFRYSQLDYGHVMDCAFNLENHVAAYSKVLRLAAFNVYSHNRDDHSKNISFLMNAKGQWQLAPAYDLTFSSSSHGMHSTMVAGESRAPGQKQLLELATAFSMNNPEQIIRLVKTVINNWQYYAEVAGVSKTSTRLIQKELQAIKD